MSYRTNGITNVDYETFVSHIETEHQNSEFSLDDINKNVFEAAEKLRNEIINNYQLRANIEIMLNRMRFNKDLLYAIGESPQTSTAKKMARSLGINLNRKIKDGIKDELRHNSAPLAVVLPMIIVALLTLVLIIGGVREDISTLEIIIVLLVMNSFLPSLALCSVMPSCIKSYADTKASYQRRGTQSFYPRLLRILTTIKCLKEELVKKSLTNADRRKLTAKLDTCVRLARNLLLNANDVNVVINGVRLTLDEALENTSPTSDEKLKKNDDNKSRISSEETKGSRARIDNALIDDDNEDAKYENAAEEEQEMIILENVNNTGVQQARN